MTSILALGGIALCILVAAIIATVLDERRANAGKHTDRDQGR